MFLSLICVRYFMLASVVGFYSLPFFGRLRPVINDTSMTKLIGNCVVILVLSSALPVLSRTLGQFIYQPINSLAMKHI